MFDFKTKKSHQGENPTSLPMSNMKQRADKAQKRCRGVEEITKMSCKIRFFMAKISQKQLKCKCKNYVFKKPLHFLALFGKKFLRFEKYMLL